MSDLSKSTRAREKRSRALGLSRYHANQAAAYGLKGASGTSLPTYFGPERLLMAEATRRMEVRLKELIEEYKDGKAGKYCGAVRYLSELVPAVCCVITAKHVLDNLARDGDWQRTVGAVGNALHHEHCLRAMKKLSRGHWDQYDKTVLRRRTRSRIPVIEKTLAKAATHAGVSLWSHRGRAEVGAFMVQIMMEVGGCITFEVKPDHLVKAKGFKNRRKKIIPLPETVDWLKKAHENVAAMAPFWLPIPQPPKDWASPWDGGYWTDELPRLCLFKDYDEDTGNTKDSCPEVYSAISHLQRVPYLVNRPVYDIALVLWERDLDAPAMPKRTDFDIPPRPKDRESEEYKVWARTCAQTLSREEECRAQRILISRTFTVCKEVGIDPFFYPHQVDFRGRAYPVVSFLQPQGPDFARGLLMFRDGEVLTATGVRWLRRHLANTWGFDKATWAEREKWSVDNEELILATAANAVEHHKWMEASKPWQFLAACLEYVAWKANPTTFLSRLPVNIDGSNNGLQLFSLMLRDPLGAGATNCGTGNPQDIYTLVGKDTWQRLLDDYENPMAKAWLEFFGTAIPRDYTKRVVMVLPYGATYRGCLEYVRSAYMDSISGRKKQPIASPGMVFRYLTYLTDKMFEAVDSRLVGARKAMSWIQTVADAYNAEGMSFGWTAPSGMRIEHAYKDMRSAFVRTHVGQKFLIFRTKVPTDKLSRRRQKSAASPNFVHSVDASIMMRTMNLLAAEGIYQVTAVHDSFGTLANNVDKLGAAVRRAAMEIFQGNLLDDLYQEAQHLLKDPSKLPPPPEQGTFDINTLQQSEYFFS
jgi:DNA-directed RNA polymerase